MKTINERTRLDLLINKNSKTRKTLYCKDEVIILTLDKQSFEDMMKYHNKEIFIQKSFYLKKFIFGELDGFHLSKITSYFEKQTFTRN